MTVSPRPDAADHSTLWSNSAYLLLMSGKTTQIIGAGIGVFAVPLIAFALTGSVFWSGMISAAGEIGYLLASLPAGAVSDRVNRKNLILVCSAIGAALWASLAVTSAIGALTAWQLAVVLFLANMMSAFFVPSESAGIREVVRADQMGSAMAAMQGRGAVASLVSGPIGGVLYGIGRAWPLAASVAGYLVVGVCTLFVRKPLNGDLGHVKNTRVVASLVEGLRFVWSVPYLRVGVFIFAILNLAFSGLIFTINLHLVAVHTRPFLIGLIDAVAGASMLVGALAAGPLVKRFRGGRLAVASVIVTVIGASGLVIAHDYGEYLPWIVIATIMVPTLNAALLGYASAITPSALQGRMNSVLSLSSVAVTPIAPIVAGALLGGVNVNAALGVFAVLLAIGGVIFIAYRPIRSIGTPEHWADDAVVWPVGGVDARRPADLAPAEGE